MGKTFRIATQLEVKHYRDLIRPITDYLDRYQPPENKLPPEMRSLTEKIKDELERFGYVPTSSCLMINIGDPSLDNPVLTPEQEEAIHVDLNHLWAVVLGKSG